MISNPIAVLATRTPLGWRQLRHKPMRLAVALAGVVFANMLIFMQLGVMGALFENAVKPVRVLSADIMLLSPEARQFGKLGTLPRRRLYQALGVEGVTSGASLYVGSVSFRTPISIRQANVTVFGVDPEFDGFVDPEISVQRAKLRVAETALLDRLTRRPFGAIAQVIDEKGAASVEVSGRTISLAGLFSLGASFDADGTAIVSDQTFFRLFPRRSGAAASAIMLKVDPEADIDDVANRLKQALPASDTQVMTTEQYADYIKDYMRDNTAIGFIFTFGVVFGFVIGFAIVYQILSADVNDHLAEYATFKAMGYSHGYLLGVVFEEALLLAALGFVPGVLMSLGLYAVIAKGTELAIDMPLDRAALVLVLTFSMCCLSGLVATRRLKAADPADVF
ncbi:MAG: ABC transporter permease DevC [Methyloceanibacter sp.]|nr:ABC transporter permease DevC [Methyloceanibacter sp.]